MRWPSRAAFISMIESPNLHVGRLLHCSDIGGLTCFRVVAQQAGGFHSADEGRDAQPGRVPAVAPTEYRLGRVGVLDRRERRSLEQHKVLLSDGKWTSPKLAAGLITGRNTVDEAHALHTRAKRPAGAEGEPRILDRAGLVLSQSSGSIEAACFFTGPAAWKAAQNRSPTSRVRPSSVERKLQTGDP